VLTQVMPEVETVSSKNSICCPNLLNLSSALIFEPFKNYITYSYAF